MPINKSKGNMYSWVDYTHSHLGGECPHKCSYCYVNSFPFGRPEKYKGPLHLIEKEFKVRYGKGKTIFIEHCNDLFAKEVPSEFIDRIIHHCKDYPENIYVFQSKNPWRFHEWSFPRNTILGTTLETNRNIPGISKAPPPRERAEAMVLLPIKTRKFITIEPVLDFDVDILAGWIAEIGPEFLNLGADSKNHNLPEPSIEKIMILTANLAELGIELREKHNPNRLKIK